MGPLAIASPRHGEVGDRAQEGGEEGESDQGRIHLAATREVLVPALLPAAVVIAETDRTQLVTGDENPVEPRQSAAGDGSQTVSIRLLMRRAGLCVAGYWSRSRRAVTC